jgi:hypothetical protein
MRFGDEIAEQVDGRFRDLRLIEELDDQREIDVKPQNVVGSNLAARAKSGYAAENGYPLDGVPILQKSKDFLHQRPALSVVRFAEIDAHHQHVVAHPILPS